MKCSVCGRGGLRVTTIVHVTNGARIERKRACAECAKKALLFLAQAPSARCKCGEQATVCHVCAGEKERRGKKEGADVAAIVKRLKALGPEGNLDKLDDYQTGRVDGIECAIELLESGRW